MKGRGLSCGEKTSVSGSLCSFLPYHHLSVSETFFASCSLVTLVCLLVTSLFRPFPPTAVVSDHTHDTPNR